MIAGDDGTIGWVLGCLGDFNKDGSSPIPPVDVILLGTGNDVSRSCGWNWADEAKGGFEQSKLSNQCNHMYKIYAEGYTWSISLKYIMSCGSTTLIISPEYEDFFSQGLLPKESYWPVSPTDLCRSIKFVVDWGNANPSDAEAIVKRRHGYMESISMNRAYDYIIHLITEYSKLQKFKPEKPFSAKEVCKDCCFASQSKKRGIYSKHPELDRLWTDHVHFQMQIGMYSGG